MPPEDLRADRPTVRRSLRGPHVVLRAPREGDKAARRALGNHPELMRMLGVSGAAVPPLRDDEVERWYARIEANPLHWIVEADSRCVGAAQLHHLDPHNRRARYAVALFDPSVWNQGIGTEVTRVVLRYAFTVMHLHRVDLRVLEYNVRAIRAYEKAGFQREGFERDTVFVGGTWYGDVIMGVLEDEFRQVAGTWTEFPASFEVM